MFVCGGAQFPEKPCVTVCRVVQTQPLSRRAGRKAPEAFLISLGGNAARPPRLGGYIKPLCVTWLWPSVAKTQMLTANFKTSDPAVVEPQSSSLALRKDFRMNFASALLSNFDVYTFTQVQFDRFDSLFGFHKFFLHTRRAYRHRSPPIGPNCTLPMFSKGGVWTNSWKVPPTLQWPWSLFAQASPKWREKVLL